MVHRIQNRNPGYSDFSGINMSDSLIFQASTNTPISDGATALKLEDEVHVNNDTGLNETQYVNNINETNSHLATELKEDLSTNEEQNIENQNINETETLMV